jgi:uncharacterized lipoprotein YmbA
MTRIELKVITFSLVCLTAWGCSPLAPRPDLSKFYLLGPVAGTATPINGRLVIGVGPIGFPDYLRRPDVVTRTGPTEIAISTNEIWGEPLDSNFARVLRENLAQRLDTQRIEEYPWARNARIDYEVEVNVQRFEKTSDGQSQMVARWIIKDGQSGKDLYSSETRTTTPVAAGDAAASSALSSNLATLSQDIATQVASLSRQRTQSTNG